MNNERQITINFTTPLGHSVSLTVPENQVDAVIREKGKQRWSAIPPQPGGVVQPGGLRLSLDNEHDFDWSLLGGYKFAHKDKKTGEVAQIVWCRGHLWTRREYEESKQMSAAVKYSRGAVAGDPPEIIEEAKGISGYVTLVVFRPNYGRRLEQYAIPK